MMKIFISNIPVFLLERTDKHYAELTEDKSVKNTLILQYSGKESLKLLIEKLEKGVKEKAVRIYHTDAKELFDVFNSLYKPIYAAGGLVKNNDNEVLMIYRKSRWDLPKGKIEKGESKEIAALREVTEETGLKQLKLQEQLFIYSWKQSSTFHTYIEDGVRMLKYTYWFAMKSNEPSDTFNPQLEEGITKAEWVPVADLPKLMRKSYGSINDILAVIK